MSTTLPNIIDCILFAKLLKTAYFIVVNILEILLLDQMKEKLTL